MRGHLRADRFGFALRNRPDAHGAGREGALARMNECAVAAELLPPLERAGSSEDLLGGGIGLTSEKVKRARRERQVFLQEPDELDLPLGQRLFLIAGRPLVVSVG